MGGLVLRLTGSTAVCAALWIVSLSWLLIGQATLRPGAHRIMLAAAVASTVVAAVDRHARQLAEVSALSYRAGSAAARREALVAADPAGDPPD